ARPPGLLRARGRGDSRPRRSLGIAACGRSARDRAEDAAPDQQPFWGGSRVLGHLVEPAPPRPREPRVSAIETPRLILARWGDDDLGGLRELTQRPEVMRHVGARVVLTREQVEQEHAAKLAHWREHGFGARAAMRRDTSAWIGYAVLQHPRPDIVELDPSEVEIGWLLLPSAWGRG